MTQPYFAAFARDGVPLKLQIPSGNVDATLGRAFSGHIRIATSGPSSLKAAFNSKLLWALTADNQRNLGIFDGHAFLQDFEFGWRADEFDKTGEKIIGEVLLAGNGYRRPSPRWNT